MLGGRPGVFERSPRWGLSDLSARVDGSTRSLGATGRASGRANAGVPSAGQRVAKPRQVAGGLAGWRAGGLAGEDTGE
jgi:hypothetical protein